MNPITWVMRGLIRCYQLFISPVLPPSCRFMPSCSAYAIDALAQHGPVKGTYLAAHRICRCHPWNDGGFDPVPAPRVPKTDLGTPKNNPAGRGPVARALPEPD